MLMFIYIMAFVCVLSWLLAVNHGHAVLYLGVRDFLWSMCMQLALVIAGVLLLWLRPEGTALSISYLFDTHLQIFVASCFLAFFILALARSLRFTIQANGRALGLVLFIPKTMAGLLIVWVCGGVLSLLLGKKRTIKRTALSIFVFGFAGILIEALITPAEKQ